MFPTNGGASMADKSSGKRKMKDVADEQPHQNLINNNNNNHLFNLHGQQQLASPNVQRVQQILNTAAQGHFRPSTSTVKPFSYLSLLTAPDDDVQDISHDYEVEQIINRHSGNLKHVLATMLNDYRHVAEESATKKLKEKEEEKTQRESNQTTYLETMLELYKGESQRLSIRARGLERTIDSLRARLEEANADRAEIEPEDADSSFEDPDRVGPVMLECKVCERQLATAVIWPCLHVCLCKGCEKATRVCPVCGSFKTARVGVRFPLE